MNIRNLFGRKKKNAVTRYLALKEHPQPFDLLLTLWVADKLKPRLEKMGLKRVSLHVDWLPECRCLEIQAVYGKLIMDWQFGPEEFSYTLYDEHEPDEPTYCTYAGMERASDVLRFMQTRIERELRRSRKKDKS